MLIGIMFFSTSSKAEGTKQLDPSSSDKTMLMTNNASYGSFASYDGALSTRLFIHINDPSNETVYLGFSQKDDGTGNAYQASSYYFRIKDPSGNIVYGPIEVNSSTANTDTYALAVAGPQPIVGGGGYSPFTFDPSGLSSGDYYIEFSDNAAATTTALFDIRHFDITVAETSGSPVAIDGRVWAYNWAFKTPTDVGGGTYGNFDRAFNGQLYSYTSDGFVSKIDFATAGFRGWFFTVAFNSTGAANTGDVNEDRKSVNAANSTYIEHKLFFNDPDISVFPSGVIGTLTDDPIVNACDPSDPCIWVEATQPGQVNIILDYDQTSGVGIYDPGTADVLLGGLIDSLPGETAPFRKCIEWDGLDGLGNSADLNVNVYTSAIFTQGITHYASYDVEYVVEGYTLEIVRPTPAPGFSLKGYYDDTNIPDLSGTAEATYDYAGCNMPCHKWTNLDYGDENTINTWWYGSTDTRDNLHIPFCAPLANHDTTTTSINSSVDIDIVTNDEGTGLDPTSVTITTSPSNGTVSVNGTTGELTYTPDFGFVGIEIIWYQICNTDPTPLCDDAMVLIEINGVIGINDDNITYLNTAVSGNVLTNDQDPQGDNLSVNTILISSPSNGSVSMNTNGNYTYTPTTNYLGVDEFEYEVCDDQTASACDTVLVSITVVGEPNSANNSVIANADENQTLIDEAVSGNVLSNDADPDGDNLTVNTTPVTSPSNGSVTLNSDGTYTYTPSSGFFGTDSFEYQVCDDGSPQSCITEIVIIDILTDFDGDGSTQPVAGDDFLLTYEDISGSGNLGTNDSGGTLNTTPTSNPSNGSVVINSNGTYTYTPNGGYVGPDQFVYQRCDSDVSTSLVTTQASSDIPVSIVDNTITSAIDITTGGNILDVNVTNLNITHQNAGQLAISLTSPDGTAVTLYSYLCSNTSYDVNVDDEGQSVSVCSDLNDGSTRVPFNGSLSILDGGTSKGTWTLTVIDGTVGSTGTLNTWGLEITAEGEKCTNATAYIMVVPAPPLPPVAVDDSDETSVSTNVVIDVLDNDSDANNDIDNSSVSTTGVLQPSNGTITNINSSTGEITYSPTAGYEGVDQFEYIVCDQSIPTRLCDTATVTVIIADCTASTSQKIIKGKVFYDANANGTDNSESGVENVDVKIYEDVNEDGFVDGSDVLLSTETTDVNGRYSYTSNAGSVSVSDDFSSGGYTGGTGTWATDWVVNGGASYAGVASQRGFLQFAYTNDEFLRRSVDLSGTISATLAFDWETVGLDVGEVFSIQASSDGSSFTTISSFTGTQTGSFSQDITSYISNNTTIRFINDGPNWSSGEYGYFDNVSISATTVVTHFVMETDIATYPTDNTLTTDNIETATNLALEDCDVGNDFGLHIADKDGDGIADKNDLDDDNDGIPDIKEICGVLATDYSCLSGCTLCDPSADDDSDGILNYQDPDFCTLNVNGVCTSMDQDGDGIIDNLDLDADNDGIPDIIEAGGIDTNGDGVIDYPTPTDPTSMVDLDGDGLADAYDDTDTAGGTPSWVAGTPIANLDSDGDGTVDAMDLDADNDGIPDIVEMGGVDSNGDGIVDNLTDNDSDGFADVYDPDDDGSIGVDAGEGTQPLVETDGLGNELNGETGVSLDTDGDGLANNIDLDADNDGIPDLVEAEGIDSDGNGLVDVTTDADGDGFADIYDTDDDGTAGVEDATDALLMTGGTDTDGDGKADDVAITFVDGDNVSADTDGDLYPDHLDLDSDNDGIPDILEAGGSSPLSDGMVDVLAAPWDSDNDGLADIYDENNSGTALVETTADSNSDGKVNAAESMSPGGSNIVNTDGDPYPNHLDLDADNDGITDVVENAGGSVSADHSSGTLDGIVGDNTNVTDTDNDGWHDPSTTLITDSDGDGIPDYLDIDADNDGIVDYLEGVCSTCPTFLLDPQSNPTDANGNGVLDIYENLNSSNGTGGSNIGSSPNVDDDSANSTPDYLDTDIDSDGANDWTEGYDSNNNGLAVDDLMNMATNYETATSNGYYVNATDTDSDGIPDWLDNQPSVGGHNETDRPPFLNPASAFWYDDDNDGLVDLLDSSQSGTAAPTPDNNGGNDLDWRDMTSVAILPVELTSFNVYEKDCAAQLKWVTGSENNFDHFVVEGSKNGSGFSRLAIVESTGNVEGSTYSYIDKKVTYANYYRLKIVDLDGSIEYSKVVYVKVDCEDLEDEMNLYPNPILKGQVLTFEFSSTNTTETIVIVDMLGSIVRQLSIGTENGKNKLELDISNLARGSYYVKLLGRKTTKMIMIQ
ncbi:MAG: Ig-like domain-containing protein [Saprospiraceae bacterium]